jgi:radical SAM superfamily enzyme YgiQ (UPF0313 family)
MIRAIAGAQDRLHLAPEAGTERLRRVINKAVTDTDLMDAAETIFASGWNVLKLYFMIGLPTETVADLDGSSGLLITYLHWAKVSKRHIQLNISVSTFVRSHILPSSGLDRQHEGHQGQACLLGERAETKRDLLETS